MLCTHCGAKLPENSRFCPECGRALSQSAGTQPHEEGVRLRVARPTCSAPGYGKQPPAEENVRAKSDEKARKNAPVPAEKHADSARSAEKSAPADASSNGNPSPENPAENVRFEPAEHTPRRDDQLAAPGKSAEQTAAPSEPEAVYEPFETANEPDDVKPFEPKKPSRARSWTAPSGTKRENPPQSKPEQTTVFPKPSESVKPLAEQQSAPQTTPTPPKQTKTAARKSGTLNRLSAFLSSRQGKAVAVACIGAAILLLVIVLVAANCGGSDRNPGSVSSGVPSESSVPSFVPSENSDEPAIPDVLNEYASDAEQTLTDAGYTVVLEERYDETTEIGRVAAQQPSAGEPLAVGGQVTLTVSLGPDLSDTVVPWSDPAVEMAVRICLGIGTGDVRVSDLDAITVLVLDGAECRVNTEETARSEESEGSLGLDDVPYFRNLKAVYLYGQNVSTLEPMRGMTELQTLVVEGGTVSDLSPLGSLHGLTSVTVTDCAVRSAEPLEELPSLTVLDLSGNPLSSFESLSGLTGLKILRLNRCGVSDLMPLVSLTGLSELRLEENGLTSADALAGMKELTALSLAGNRLPNLQSLEKLTSLTVLDVSANGLETLAGLEKLSSLEALDVSDNAFTTIEELSGMTRLKTLYLDHMSIKDVSPLYHCQNLTYLSALTGQTSVGSLVDPYQELRERLPNCEIVTQ